MQINSGHYIYELWKKQTREQTMSSIQQPKGLQTPENGTWISKSLDFVQDFTDFS